MAGSEPMIKIRTAPTWLGDQVTALLGPWVDAIRRRRLRSLWMGPAAAVLVVGLALAFRTRSGHAFVVADAITRPGDPLYLTLVKLPLSMFAPAALLPFWFAIAQVAVVYSLAQALVGARATALVALTGHTLATVTAYLWILAGPPIGVGHRYDHFADAGPSVAVVSLLAYIALSRRASWLAIGMITYHAIEVGIFNALSQREHLIGTVTGALAGAATRHVAGRRSARSARSGRSARSAGAPVTWSRTSA
jgi:hypothetical protein